MNKSTFDWYNKKKKLERLCPRKEHYCYGAPMSNKGENIGKCPHRKNGKCVLMEDSEE